jgi:protein-S-isoprenylcysteine O-methyltransferase Ste14
MSTRVVTLIAVFVLVTAIWFATTSARRSHPQLYGNILSSLALACIVAVLLTLKANIPDQLADTLVSAGFAFGFFSALSHYGSKWRSGRDR